MLLRNQFFLIIAGIYLTLFACPAFGQTRPDNPETAVQQPGFKTDQRADGPGAMVVTANAHATDAALQMLRSGGNAIDATIAAQLVLGLTEPQSSGLGGGAFILYYDAGAEKLYTIDGRETAPQKADDNLFLKNGAPMPFWDAVIGGRAVGTPGTPKLLNSLHKRFGAKNWAPLFDPALALADNGFVISPRLAGLIAENKGKLDRYKKTKEYFYHPDGQPKRAGETLKNPDYAETLREFRSQGEVTFYRGALAHEIVAAIRRVPDNPGLLSLNDLKAYEVKDRPNTCGPYRGYQICSMGEPSSGALTLLQILGMLERFDLGDSPNSSAIHLITEASRLAFADRNFYMADPDYIETPGRMLISPDYLKRRSDLIRPNMRLSDNAVTPGIPDGWLDRKRSPDNVIKPPGTTHLAIVDQHGNMVSMTSTIEQAFGSRLMTNGFLLNNELTDFSFVPEKNGWEVANKVEGGKRPRSSMSPTIIFTPDGTPFMIVGSAGGSRIIGYVLKTIIHAIDWDTPLDKALAAPHFLSRGKGIEMEPGLEAHHPELQSLSHSVIVGNMNSGLNAIRFHKDGTKTGAADPRREGKAENLDQNFKE